MKGGRREGREDGEQEGRGGGVAGGLQGKGVWHIGRREEGGRMRRMRGEWKEDWTCKVTLLLMPTASARSEGNTV